MTDPRFRLRYARGQRILARDLRDQAAFDAQMRWWHNRAAHHAGGVASGLEVRLAGGTAEIEPGVAYDRRGRELVVGAVRTVSLPAGLGPACLVLYLCAGRPELAWEAGDGTAHHHDGVTLARLGVDEQGEPHLVVAGARSRRTPYMALGGTPPGATDWRPWKPAATGFLERPLGVQVTVDTTAAGFGGVPCYFAWPVWPDPAARPPHWLAWALPNVVEPGPTRFVFRLAMPQISRAERAADLDTTVVRLVQAQAMCVRWIGIGPDTLGGS
ncbi:hypothetical protein [Sphaerisporangium rhizosphaerae]|uniref:Uncharacterized protein n=1 Tax=Sphaerisporangium rhizosphaerae TaxID=2269375 RepID=A0ABW2PEL6_9ACTN